MHPPRSFALAATLLALLSAALAPAASVTINNDTVWNDTAGNPILAQGGHLLRIGDTFHWYGVEMYATSQFYGVRCYTSTDLKNWTYRGYVLKNGQRNANGNIVPELNNPGWIGRPSVVKHPTATPVRYVMVFSLGRTDIGFHNRVAYADCDVPSGKLFTFRGYEAVPANNKLNGLADNSVTVFGTDAYLVCAFDEGITSDTTKWHANLGIFKLRPSDFLRIQSAIYTAPNTQDIEAPALLQRNNKYLFTGSKTNGWNPSPTQYAVAPTLAGPWNFQPMPTTPATGNSRQSQHDALRRVVGDDGATSFVFYMGDRWSNRGAPGVGRYVWLPVTFTGDVPTLMNEQTWTLNVDAGTFSLAP
jgi:hypothetical protein